VRLTRRQIARLHDQAIAVVAVLEADEFVVELSVHVHMLLLSLCEALEFGDRNLVRELAELMPEAWRDRLPQQALAIANAIRRAGAGDRAQAMAMHAIGGAS
jgi:hypothetical protein